MSAAYAAGGGTGRPALSLYISFAADGTAARRPDWNIPTSINQHDPCKFAHERFAY